MYIFFIESVDESSLTEVCSLCAKVKLRSFVFKQIGLESCFDKPHSPRDNTSFALSPSTLIYAYTKCRLVEQHTTEADCSSAPSAGASTRKSRPRVLDHAGACAQSPDKEGLLLANLQRTKTRSLQRKCPTEQHPSPHPPSCLVIDRRRPSHHLRLKSPHLEPRSSQC